MGGLGPFQSDLVWFGFSDFTVLSEPNSQVVKPPPDPSPDQSVKPSLKKTGSHDELKCWTFGSIAGNNVRLSSEQEKVNTTQQEKKICLSRTQGEETNCLIDI